ncbi:hypothetical protein [Brevundimonas diminuta]|uniref:hypothetical protein n=1 Tax=Brevundimonas diminuta TaxID=293 RepID=UPI003208DDC3
MSLKSFKPLGIRGAVLVFAGSLLLGLIGGVAGTLLSDQAGLAGFVMTAAVLAVVMGGALLISVWWWRHIDEAAREAHKWSWFWGGIGGIAIGAPLLLVLSMRRDEIQLPHWLGETPPDLLLSGMMAILLFQLIGYGVAWAWWWLARR